MLPLSSLADRLRSRQMTSLALVNECIERIEDPTGEGRLTYLHVDEDGARKAAVAMDLQREAGIELSPLMGIPLSVKDLFDVAGQTTQAGSKVLEESSQASKDAPVIARLRRAGAVILGRTNMTEFAYSGVGLNPHFGTPASPFERHVRRIPGGSSSGAGVSIADGMAAFALGTDTGGSVRIPAACCGLVGFKPTQRRVPTKGAFPLSSSFDSVGPLAPTVKCCITVDRILSGQPADRLKPWPLKGLRFLTPRFALEDLDNPTASSFSRTIGLLRDAGALIDEKGIDLLEDPMRAASGARLLGAEAYAVHKQLLENHKDEYDPRVASRLMPASAITAAEYIDLLAWRRSFIENARNTLSVYDALLLPTTPRIPPPIEDLEHSDDVYFSTNKLMLRNTSLINQLDGCALSIPCHRPGEPPSGIMIAGMSMMDRKVLKIGLSVEQVLRVEVLGIG